MDKQCGGKGTFTILFHWVFLAMSHGLWDLNSLARD